MGNRKKMNLFSRFGAFIKRKLSGFTVSYARRPITMTVLILVALNLVVLLIAAAIAMQLTDYPNYFWAFINAATWLVAPNAVLAHTDLGMQILTLIVLITGMILFTGTIVAIITTYLRGYINKKSEAKGKLNLAEHIVILNYNSKVAAMLIDLMYSNCNCTVLVLSHKIKGEIQDELNRELASIKGKKPQYKLRLIARKGAPESVAELEEICIDKANGILIVEPEHSYYDNSCNDEDLIGLNSYSTIRLVMKLANLTLNPNCPIGVETEKKETVSLIRELNASIEGLKDKHIQVFSHNKKLGQFLALSILCPPLASVLQGLLSNTGYIFVPVEIKKDDYLENYTGGIPVVELDNKTYVLSENKKATYKKRSKKSIKQMKSVKPDDKFFIRPPATMPPLPILKLFVIGKNRKTDFMLASIKDHKRQIEIRQFEASDINSFVNAVCKNNSSNTIALILSNDAVCSNQYDANVFLTLIAFTKICNLADRKFKLIAELLEPDNQIAVEKFSVNNIIISTRIISFFATKLLSDPVAEKFYEDVFTHSKPSDKVKFDIWINNADILIDFEDNSELQFNSFASFISSFYHGHSKQKMPLGIIDSSGTIKYLCKNMDTSPLTIFKKTPILYVEYL